jgi:hypothetical protein
MKSLDIDPDDDAVFDTTREHSNPEGCGYCCPHCLETSKHDECCGVREAVECDHCHKPFVIWNETEIRQCSGHLAMEPT